LISHKLKQVRILLGISQEDAARSCGITQRDISQLENGKKVFIHTQYIQYLHNVGIDLNSLFSESEVRYVPKTLKTGDPPEKCNSCKLKDETISAQKVTIEALQKTVEVLSARESHETPGQKRKVG
jgi:transcriptional regulator with XRE-family HTH domain